MYYRNSISYKVMQIDPYLSLNNKSKSKCIKDLNRNPDTMNLIEGEVGNSPEHIGTWDNFLNRTTIAQILKINN